jgi:hypothetical protein
VHQTQLVSGDTTSVSLRIANASPNTISRSLFPPFPALEIVNAQGDTVQVTYLGSPVSFYDFVLAPGTHATWSQVLQIGGTPVSGATAIVDLSPGTYSVAACITATPGSCGQDVSITVSQ